VLANRRVGRAVEDKPWRSHLGVFRLQSLRSHSSSSVTRRRPEHSIDDSVVVLENTYRHIEIGEQPRVAAIQGTNEIALAVLAIMLVAVVVFFPVTFLFGVSKYLFSALALGVVLALFASYFCAVTVVPLYCA
jgi:hypothetical protein